MGLLLAGCPVGLSPNGQADGGPTQGSTPSADQGPTTYDAGLVLHDLGPAPPAPDSGASDGGSQSAAPCHRWSTPTVGTLRDLRPDSSGTLFAVGETAGSGFLVSLDSCGKVARQLGYKSTNASSVAAHGLELDAKSIHVVGRRQIGGVTEARFVGFDKTTLDAVGGTTINTSSGTDELRAIAVADSALWLSGTASVNTANPTLWGYRAAGTDMCGFSIIANGVARRVVSGDANDVYFVGSVGDSGFIARFDTSCATTSCAACKPSWTAVEKVSNKPTEWHSLVVQGSAIYAVGLIDDGGSTAIVARLSTTGKVLESAAFGSAGAQNAFYDIGSDATGLYVVGVDGSSAVAMKLALSPLSKVLWNNRLDSGAYHVVIPYRDDTLLIAGGGESDGGIVRRCLRSSGCR